jgi:hypothetical protein
LQEYGRSTTIYRSSCGNSTRVFSVLNYMKLQNKMRGATKKEKLAIFVGRYDVKRVSNNAFVSALSCRKISSGDLLKASIAKV